MIETDRIICGDNVEVMKSMPDKSIDLTVTSPPYDNLRTYKGYSFDFESVAQELYRITKDGGVIVWIVGDATINFCESLSSFKQAIYFVEGCNFNLFDTMIYAKVNYAPAYPTMRRYAQVFEYMFVLSKGKPKTFNPIQTEKKRKKNELGCKTRNKDGTQNKSKIIKSKKNTKDANNLWIYPTDKAKGAKNHPAVFPEQLAEDHILSWSNPDDIVLDPFAGSGTTLKMAAENKRKYIRIEISEEYCGIIKERLSHIQERLF